MSPLDPLVDGRLNSTSKNSGGSDGINIKNLQSLGPLAIKYLTNMYNTALNTNTIPHFWTLCHNHFIPKQNKYRNIGTNYGPISLLFTVAETLAKKPLPYCSVPKNCPNYVDSQSHKKSL